MKFSSVRITLLLAAMIGVSMAMSLTIPEFQSRVLGQNLKGVVQNLQTTVEKLSKQVIEIRHESTVVKEGPLGPPGAEGLPGIAGKPGKDGAAGAKGDSGDPCSNCVFLQSSTPGTPQTGHLNISGTGTLGSLKISGSALFQTAIDSPTAFQIQNSLGSSALTVDSSSLTLTVGGDVLASPTQIVSTTQVTTAVDTQNSTGGFTFIAVAPDGLPIISYQYNTGLDLRVAKCGNADCSSGNTVTTVESTGAVGYNSSLGFGTDGLPIISHFDTTNDDLRVVKCGNAACSSGNVATAVDTTGLVGQWLSLAIGLDGLAVISYQDVTNGDLKVAKCGDATCSAGNTITSVDTTNVVGKWTFLAIGVDGFPVIFHYDETNADLRVVKCGNAACSSGNTLTTVDSLNDVGRYSSLTIGVDGLPVISYYDFTNGDLRILKCGNAACSSGNTATAVDTAGDVGSQETTISIGTDGLPIVSYHDATNLDLKVLKCGNASCSSGNIVTSVETDGSVGSNNHLALMPDQRPIISYYDAINFDLKVTRCANSSCSSTTGNTYSGGSNLGSTTKFFQNIYGVNYFGKNFSISNFDLAEEFPVEDLTLGAGEIVAVNPASGKLKRAGSDDRLLLLGVISTSPGLALRDYESSRADTRLIALAGRVPVKVKGSVQIGDPITISETAGVGAKATSPGLIVGRALTPNGDGIGTVQLFVQIGYYDAAMHIQSSSNIELTDLTTEKLMVSGSARFLGNLRLERGHIVGNRDVAGSLAIPPGKAEVTHTFSQPYEKVPQVVVSPTVDPRSVRYWVTRSESGFTIHLSSETREDLYFSYVVIE